MKSTYLYTQSTGNEVDSPEDKYDRVCFQVCEGEVEVRKCDIGLGVRVAQGTVGT